MSGAAISAAANGTAKPALGFWQIWNMCFGFLGIQMGFALQNANVSRIFQTLGASVDDIPILWIAAPVTGLVVQPIVGYYSDRTWTRLGRRRPYFLGGAILASLALVVMPNSPGLWIAAGTLWIMDASINVSMEPFRAFVGDMLPARQRTLGFAMQSFFIGVGAVAASALPWLMTNWMGIDNTAPAGEIPLSVKYAFYVGAAGFFIAVLWTVISSREYPPEVLLGAEAAHANEEDSQRVTTDDGLLRRGGASLAAGLLFALAVFWRDWDQQLHVLAGMAVAFGLLQLLACLLHRAGRGNLIAARIVEDLYGMPRTMRQLALVQFFSWFGLFTMWIYSTPAVTLRHFGATDPGSAAYNTGADWVGVLFAAYNGFAALAAFLIPMLANRFGRRLAHLVCMVMGGAGLASFAVISDPTWLLLSMVGVGIAWAAILSLPYAILSTALPAAKMGVYMGIFNFFIVIPQLLAAGVLGFIVREAFNGDAVYALALGGACIVISGLAMLRVSEP